MLGTEAAGRTDETGGAVPATAAQDAKGARQWSTGVLLRAVLIVIFLVPFLAPFPYITGHVIQTKPVRFPSSNRVSHFTAVFIKPGISSKFIQVAGTGPLFLLTSTTGRVFPFRLVRQAIISTSTGIQLSNKLLYIFPGNGFNRTIAATLTKQRWVVPHYCLPLRLCDQIFANEKV